MPKSAPAPISRYHWVGSFYVYKDVKYAQVLYDDTVLAAATSNATEKLFFKVIAFNPAHGIVSAVSFETIEAAKIFAVSWVKDGPLDATKPYWLKEADRKADGKPQMTDVEKAAALAIEKHSAEHNDGEDDEDDEDGQEARDDILFGPHLGRR